MKIVHTILAFNSDDDLVHEVRIPESEVSAVIEFLNLIPWYISPGDHEIGESDARMLCKAYGSPFEVDGLSWYFGAFREHKNVPKI